MQNTVEWKVLAKYCSEKEKCDGQLSEHQGDRRRGNGGKGVPGVRPGSPVASGETLVELEMKVGR